MNQLHFESGTANPVGPPGFPVERTFEKTFAASLEQMDRVIAAANQFWAATLSPGERFVGELLLRELVGNAVVHGSCLDAGRSVRCRIRLAPAFLSIAIADTGEGFDWKQRLEMLAPESACSGRGMEIMRLYSQRFRFNRKGNCVVVWMPLAPIAGTSHPNGQE